MEAALGQSVEKVDPATGFQFSIKTLLSKKKDI